MKYTIAPAEGTDYVVIEVHGVINRQVGMEIVTEAHVVGNQLGLNKYFMDVTDSVNDDSTLDQYQFANKDVSQATSVNPLARVAVLVAPDDHSHDFIETVLRNVGINFRLFRDRNKAMVFLAQGRAENKYSSNRPS